MTSYCITFSSCSARIRFCFLRIFPTAKAGKTQRWKSLNERIFPKRKRKSCCTTTPCDFSANPSPDYSPYGEKAFTHCKPRSGYAWFKTFKPFEPFKTSEKQREAVERSAAIEHLEQFDQLYC